MFEEVCGKSKDTEIEIILIEMKSKVGHIGLCAKTRKPEQWQKLGENERE